MFGFGISEAGNDLVLFGSTASAPEAPAAAFYGTKIFTSLSPGVDPARTFGPTGPGGGAPWCSGLPHPRGGGVAVKDDWDPLGHARPAVVPQTVLDGAHPPRGPRSYRADPLRAPTQGPVRVRHLRELRDPAWPRSTPGSPDGPWTSPSRRCTSAGGREEPGQRRTPTTPTSAGGWPTPGIAAGRGSYPQIASARAGHRPPGGPRRPVDAAASPTVVARATEVAAAAWSSKAVQGLGRVVVFTAPTSCRGCTATCWPGSSTRRRRVGARRLGERAARPDPVDWPPAD